ncbi:MAG: 30S ribosomal protein S4 [Methanobacteriota archaeon]|nr:MAG: 30S ribosomal protein S4 [Euryarchaeota archaeon]
MGDPKFSRRKYDKPTFPWEGDRIQAENELIKKYGLKNKKELWKAQSMLRNIRQRSRILQAKVRYEDQQAEKEKDELLKKLGSLGLLPLEGATLNDVLALDVEAILSRRLQTLAYVKGLAYTPKQARQMIVHGHTSIGERKVTVPGYLVKRDEENMIKYSPNSPLAHDLHPARPDVEKIQPPSEEVKEEKEEEKEEEKAKEPEPKKAEEGEEEAEKDEVEEENESEESPPPEKESAKEEK